MSYKFFNKDTNKYSFVDMPNCEINTGSKKYVVKDGEITVFDVVDGKVKKDSCKQVQHLELSDNQFSVFNNIKSRDNYTDRFDYDDLIDLDDDFKDILMGTYGDKKATKYKRISAKKKSLKYKVKNKTTKEIEFFEIVMDKPKTKSKFSTSWLGRIFTGKPRAKVMKYTSPEFKYKVGNDETTETIAKKYDVDITDLIDANTDMWELNELKIDKKIIIPKTENSKKKKHRVVQGDTLESIARQYNVNISDLKKANKKALYKSFKEPQQGDKITIPQTLHKTVVQEKNVVTIPQIQYIAGADNINAATLANDYDVTLYRLQNLNPNLKNTAIKKGDAISIPEHKTVTKLHELSIKAIAEEVGVTEAYIRDILFGIEGRHSKPDLEAYDDKVAPRNSDGTKMSEKQKEERQNKGWAIGTPTIGFGHTGRVHGVYMGRNSSDWNKVRITEEEAYLILANDIYSAKQDAIAYFGEDFEKAPQSIQDAIVDIIFNKGVEGLERKDSPSKNLKKDLENQDYVAAAADVIVDPTIPGLMKRNLYRVLTATRDLDEKDRKKVLEKTEAYKNKALDSLKNGNTKRKLEYDWERALNNNITNGFFN